MASSQQNLIKRIKTKQINKICSRFKLGPDANWDENLYFKLELLTDDIYTILERVFLEEKTKTGS